MEKIIIVGMSKNRTIGKNGKLPWHIPEDLKSFKEITTGGTIVMGRKTYESIGKPLPNRRNIILSSQKIDGLETYASIEEMLEKLENENIVEKIFIIGGTQIYQTFLNKNLVDYIYLSLIPGEFEGDTYFPAFEDKFTEIERKKFENFELIKHKKTPC
ncbi:MAG: dihydrofolate reductase [Candidatus Gracilibacteria bacterium]|nr:dihydrofolate reductase [Candidatus Gracilibacteria bacterium]